MNATGQARSQRGVGLIEVLVALVVISLGVLGMAGLQLKGMQQSTAGYNRSKALMLAENMATLMRINYPGVSDGDYVGLDSDVIDCAVKPTTYCQASGVADADDCNTAELAAFDFFTVACGDWGNGGTSAGVKQSLPQGRIQVSCDGACASDSTYTIEVDWVEGRGRASSLSDTIERTIKLRMRP